MDVQTHDVAAHDGLALNCLERSPPDAEEAVLFVHGVITNARGLFDTPVDGDRSYSWLQAAAERGRAAFAMDQRGYGDSERPPEMDQPPEANDPPVRADRAAADVDAVLEWLHEDFDTVHLVGVSWGCHTTGRHVERADPDVASLVHCAPVYEPAYAFEDAVGAIGIEDVDFAWFEQSRETVRARSDHEDHVFDAIWRAQVDSGQGVDEETFVAQAGGIADWKDSVDGDPVWDPANIEVPTLVFYGGEDDLADRQGSLACYDRLGTDAAEYVEFADVDHYVMHADRRDEVFDLVSAFQDRFA
jgi:pimeloyl-ACP methyl ester carboxylesterase